MPLKKVMTEILIIIIESGTDVKFIDSNKIRPHDKLGNRDSSKKKKGCVLI
jgi:hypothetical protein